LYEYFDIDLENVEFEWDDDKERKNFTKHGIHLYQLAKHRNRRKRGIVMAMISMKDIKKELTDEEMQEIEALDERPIIYDEDSPELSIEQIKQFKRMDHTKQTVSIRLSPQTMEKAKALGKGYTSVLSRLLDAALNDEEMVKKCL
jgi:uncharacterized protein (DUF4415 family)